MRSILTLLILVLLSHMTDAQKKTMQYLALGDSYTIGESVAEEDRWPAQLVAALNAKGQNFAPPRYIATTGWRTDDLKKAIVKAKLPSDYDLVSLLIGVNNQYQKRSVADYAPEFEELLKMAISFTGGDASKVVVLSIPDYGFTPFGNELQESITKEIDEFNAVNKAISSRYGVVYVDITDISRRALDEPQLLATDRLHPSGKMYQEWVSRVMPALKQ